MGWTSTTRWTTAASSLETVEFFGGQYVFDANKSVIEKLTEAGALLRPRRDQPLLSALLALQEADHLPRHRAVVHQHGDQRPPGQGAGRDQPGALDPQMGQGADLRHDREPPGLVHLPPALLGGADHRLLLHGLRRGTLPTATVMDHVADLFKEHSSDIWYRLGAPDSCCRRGRPARPAAAAAFEKEMDILDVWFDSGVSHAAVLETATQPRLAGRHVPGGERPASRLVPLLAAGERRHPRQCPLQERADPRLRGGRQRAAR